MTDQYARYHSSSAETTLPDAQEEAVEVVPDLETAPTATGPEKSRSLGSDAWHELRRSPMFIISGILIFVLVLMAVFPSLFTNADPTYCDLNRSRQGPNLSGGWFGYDLQGCDIYARTIYGARASIMVGILTTIGVALIGGIVGLTAGFYAGWVDSVLSRFLEIFFGIPLLLGGVLVLASFPSNQNTPAWQTIMKVVLALSILAWTPVARIMRSTTIQVKNADFVQAARALGSSGPRLLRSHVLPNAVTPVIVYSTIVLGVFIATEATLSFLGIGLQPPVVSWGVDISNAQNYIRQSPHMLLFPATFLSITVLAFIVLGDAVRDALDPKLR